MIILGASGMIGRHLLAETVRRGLDAVGTFFRRPVEGLLAFDIGSGDMEDIAPDLGPTDTVVVLSAMTEPDKVRAEPETSRALNVDATIRCLASVLDAGAKVVFLSTEYVFGGAKDGHSESDERTPSTLYARQKVEVEDYLIGRDGRWCIVRTGWNAGTGFGTRCPVEKHYEMLMAGGARIATDNYFTLTDVEDTCRAILDLCVADKTGIYHVAANPPISRGDLAQAITGASRHGADMKFEPIEFAALSFVEPRPRNAWLRNDKLVGELAFEFASCESTIAKRVGEIDATRQCASAVPA